MIRSGSKKKKQKNMAFRTPTSSSRRGASQQQPPAGSPTYAELQNELLYTQDVLKRYKAYVDDKLQRQLDQYASTCEELGVECAKLRDENVLLHNRLEVAQSAAAKFREEAREAHEVVEAERRSVQSELARAREQGEDRTRQAQEQARRAEEELAAVQSALTKRDQEIRKLRVALAEREAQAAAAPGSPAQKTPTGFPAAFGGPSANAVCQALQGITSAGLDFSNTLAAACAHISIDCSGSVAAWKAFQQKPVTPEGLAESVRELAAVQRTQHTAIAQALRAFVLRQAELLESLSAKEQAHHTERELMKRRLEEVERDRKAERDAALLRAEKDRLRGAGGGGGGVAAAMGGHQRSSGEGYAWSSSTVDELVMAAASQQGSRVESVGTQTNFADLGQQPVVSGASSDTERLFAELRRLQEESAAHRSTILMLEQQRRTFLGFVDNDRVSSHVKAALSGSLTDAVRQAAGLSY